MAVRGAVLRLKGGADPESSNIIGDNKSCPMAKLPQELLVRIMDSAQDAHNVSLVCKAMRVSIALLDQYWAAQCTIKQQRDRNYPFGRWIEEKRTMYNTSSAWKEFLPYLPCQQRSALCKPTELKNILKLEKRLQQSLPLEVIWSFSHHADGQTKLSGSQAIGEYYLLPHREIEAVYASQLQRGLPPCYMPLAVDSAVQKLICVDCSLDALNLSGTSNTPQHEEQRKGSGYGRIVTWSPLYEAQIGISWAEFLRPK